MLTSWAYNKSAMAATPTNALMLVPSFTAAPVKMGLFEEVGTTGVVMILMVVTGLPVPVGPAGTVPLPPYGAVWLAGTGITGFVTTTTTGVVGTGITGAAGMLELNGNFGPGPAGFVGRESTGQTVVYSA